VPLRPSAIAATKKKGICGRSFDRASIGAVDLAGLEGKMASKHRTVQRIDRDAMA
jgi:hypothetical protein